MLKLHFYNKNPSVSLLHEFSLDFALDPHIRSLALLQARFYVLSPGQFSLSTHIFGSN